MTATTRAQLIDDTLAEAYLTIFQAPRTRRLDRIGLAREANDQVRQAIDLLRTLHRMMPTLLEADLASQALWLPRQLVEQYMPKTTVAVHLPNLYPADFQEAGDDPETGPFCSLGEGSLPLLGLWLAGEWMGFNVMWPGELGFRTLAMNLNTVPQCAVFDWSVGGIGPKESEEYAQWIQAVYREEDDAARQRLRLSVFALPGEDGGFLPRLAPMVNLATGLIRSGELTRLLEREIMLMTPLP